MNSENIVKKNNKTKKTRKTDSSKNMIVESEEVVKKMDTDSIKNEITTIKENINNVIINNEEKKIIKSKIDFSLNQKLDFTEIFQYIYTGNLSPRTIEFVKQFQEFIDKNEFNTEYFQMLSNMIHYYKLVICSLTYSKSIQKEVDYEITSIYNIPKNLIFNNKVIFDKTKYEIFKADKIVPSNEKLVSLNNIIVEEKFPSIENYLYLKKNISELNIQYFVSTIYTSWLLCLIHIKIFNQISDEYKKNVEEFNDNINLQIEKQLDKFIMINNDTNVYIKSSIYFLKKRTNRTIKKNDNKPEKIIKQDISSIEKNNIHENTNIIESVIEKNSKKIKSLIINSDSDDSDDSNDSNDSVGEKNIKSFNIECNDDSDN